MAQQQQTPISSQPSMAMMNGGQSPVRPCRFPGCPFPHLGHLWHIRSRSESPVARLRDTPRSIRRIYRQLGAAGEHDQLIYVDPIPETPRPISRAESKPFEVPAAAENGAGEVQQQQHPVQILPNVQAQQQQQAQQILPNVQAVPVNAAANVYQGPAQLLPLWDDVETELNARMWKPKDGLIVKDRCLLCLGETGIHWRFNQCGCVCICDECAEDQENLWALGDLAEERAQARLEDWHRKWDWHCPCFWDECNCQKELDCFLDPRPVCLNCQTARSEQIVRALRRKSTRQRKAPIRYSPMK